GLIVVGLGAIVGLGVWLWSFLPIREEMSDSDNMPGRANLAVVAELAKEPSAAPAFPPTPSQDGPKEKLPEADTHLHATPFVGHAGPHADSVRVLLGGKTLLTTTGRDWTARLWDIDSGREIRRLWHPAGVRQAAVCPDGRRAVTVCFDGFVRLWDLSTGRLI